MISCDIALLLLLVDQIAPDDLVVRDLDGVVARADDDRLLTGADDLALEALALGRSEGDVRPIALRKCSGVRTGRSIPGEETSIAYSRRYSRSTSVTRAQSAWSTPSAWSTKTVNRSGFESSTASTSTPGRAVSTSRPICFVSVRSFSCVVLKAWLLQQKWAQRAHFDLPEMWCRKCSKQ